MSGCNYLVVIDSSQFNVISIKWIEINLIPLFSALLLTTDSCD